MPGPFPVNCRAEYRAQPCACRADRITNSKSLEQRRCQVRGREDALVRVRPLNRLVPNWRSFLARVIREEDIRVLRAHSEPAVPWEMRNSWPPWKRFWAESSVHRCPAQNPAAEFCVVSPGSAQFPTAFSLTAPRGCHESCKTRKLGSLGIAPEPPSG